MTILSWFVSLRPVWESMWIFLLFAPHISVISIIHRSMVRGRVLLWSVRWPFHSLRSCPPIYKHRVSLLVGRQWQDGNSVDIPPSLLLYGLPTYPPQEGPYQKTAFGRFGSWRVPGCSVSFSYKYEAWWFRWGPCLLLKWRHYAGRRHSCSWTLNIQVKVMETGQRGQRWRKTRVESDWTLARAHSRA